MSPEVGEVFLTPDNEVCRVLCREYIDTVAIAVIEYGHPKDGNGKLEFDNNEGRWYEVAVMVEAEINGIWVDVSTIKIPVDYTDLATLGQMLILGSVKAHYNSE